MQRDFQEVAQATDSHRRNLERRGEARRRRVLRDNPATGPFILAMSDEPTADTAFGMGESWQRWVGEMVRRSFPEGVFLFHRTRGAGRSSDIDIVAVLRTGVWAIDIQRFDRAAAEVRQGVGPHGLSDHLYIHDRDHTDLLDDVDDQAEAVSAAIARAGFPVMATRGVLCLVDVEVAWRGHRTVGTTYVTKARPMLRLLSDGPSILDDTDIASLGLSLDKQLGRQHLRA